MMQPLLADAYERQPGPTSGRRGLLPWGGRGWISRHGLLEKLAGCQLASRDLPDDRWCSNVRLVHLPHPLQHPYPLLESHPEDQPGA